MLTVLFNWIYVFITCYIVGSFALKRLILKRQAETSSCVMAGIVILTTYAAYFSLFAGVGIAANIILIIACVIFVIIDRSDFAAKSLALITSLKSVGSLKVKEYVFSIAYLLLFVGVLYYTSYGKYAYDTGLYHAQSIRWIEEYGVVKGLAHMQSRLGFNSSYFCLCALYSFHDVGISLHTLSGFFAVLVTGMSFKGACRKFRLYYIAPVCYVVIIAMELISPTTDFATIWMIIWLLIKWAELIYAGNEREVFNYDTMKPQDSEDELFDIRPYALLSVMAVFLVSVKLSVGILALLVIYPLTGLIKKKSLKNILIYVSMGLILILPYFIRNVIISGWLIYPFPAIDLFDFDWKILPESAKYEADEIVVWARYTKDVALIDQSISEWLPVWWREQGSANRYLSLSAFLGAAVYFARLIVSVIYNCRLLTLKKKGCFATISKEMTIHRDFTFLSGIILLSFLFWFIEAPSNRFGYGYLLLLPLMTVSDCQVIKEAFAFNKVFVRRLLITGTLLVFVCLLFPMCKGLLLLAKEDVNYLKEGRGELSLVTPKDYPSCDYGTKEWEGIEISYPSIEGDQIWYEAFPAILYESNLDSLKMRGDKIKDGFCSVF